MRPSHRSLLSFAVVTLLAGGVAPGRADAGVRLSFSVSGDTLSSFVDGVSADLSCDPKLSPAGRDAWLEVVREGENGAASFRDKEDRPVSFRRDRDAFRILTRDEDGREVRLEVPWGVARCLIGGESPAPGSARRLRGEELSVDLAVDDESVELVVSQTPRRSAVR